MHFLFDNEMHCHQIFSNLDTTNYIHLDYTAASISPGIIIMGYTHHNMQNNLHFITDYHVMVMVVELKQRLTIIFICHKATQ